MKSMIFRPLRLATFGFALLLLAFLVVVSILTWTQYRRLERGRAHIERVQIFQRAFLRLSDAADRGEPASVAGDPLVLDELMGDVDELIAFGEPLAPETPRKLKELKALLQRRELDPGPSLTRALKLFQQVMTAEGAAQERLLADMEWESRVELRLTLAALLALIGLGVLILLFIRRRILHPLEGLQFVVSRLAHGEFTPVPVQDVDPLLHPLFDNYNHLVTRLEELEQEQRAHAESLQREVRMATTALLEQQRGLARAERLAATGVLAASVAHELRNPLAGIQMALANLKRESDDPETFERLDLVLDELTRLGRLVNALLDMSRHVPEQPRTFDLANSVQQLLTLTRYQLPGQVALESDISADLVCNLPEDRLRQALLNLILNAAGAVENAGGRVLVSARAEGPELRITVSDDGPGFSPDLLRGLPSPFRSTTARGTGLGLTMVHRFARDLEGDLELSNRQPHGACVTLTLPDCLVDPGRDAED